MKYELTCGAIQTPLKGPAAAIFAMARALAEAGHPVTVTPIKKDGK